MTVINYPVILIITFIFIGLMITGIVKKKNQPGYRYFIVTKLLKYQKIRKIGLLGIAVSIILIIYTSFNPTFTLFVIIACPWRWKLLNILRIYLRPIKKIIRAKC